MQRKFHNLRNYERIQHQLSEEKFVFSNYFPSLVLLVEQKLRVFIIFLEFLLFSHRGNENNFIYSTYA